MSEHLLLWVTMPFNRAKGVTGFPGHLGKERGPVCAINHLADYNTEDPIRELGEENCVLQIRSISKF